MTNSFTSHIKITPRLTTYLTVALGLIVISFFAFFGNFGCKSAQIKSKKQVLDKYFYQFSNGSQLWSNQDFSVNDNVCISYPDAPLAQK